MTETERLTGQHLLADIIENPGDDALRLIYADWLEECGTEGDAVRAEFIRVQVELTRPRWRYYDLSIGKLLRPAGAEEWDELCRRERRLRDELYEERRLRDELYEYGAYVKFSRGFVSEVECPLDVWMDSGAGIARAHPLERVTLTDRKPCRAVTKGGQTNHEFFRSEQPYHDLSRSYELPPGLWDELCEVITGGPRHDDNITWLGSTDEDRLADALSTACVRYAKRRQ